MNYDKQSDTVKDDFECGCFVFERYSIMNKETRSDIHFCPKHTAATEMYKALIAWDEYSKTNYPSNMNLKRKAVDLMDEALAKAEGKC